MKSGIVSLIGRPNSGKSTLLNAFVGQKVSIVSDKPQTTRHRILGILSGPGGQAVFVDTPGVHKPVYRMNRRMQLAVHESLRNVDLVLHLVDASVPYGAGEEYVLNMVRTARPRAMLLINKTDRVAKRKLLPVMQRYAGAYPYLEIIPISALTGDNLPLLVDRIFHYLEEGEALYPGEQVTDRSERFLAAEFIREKVLARTRAELPYTSAVLIRRFDESRRNSAHIVVVEADILVEKQSQQGIILGAGGLRLRDIGIDARREIEQLLGCKVHLALRVRTVHRWREDDSVLDQLGVGT
ncbi:MAG: GTPase Era [Acidobacteria bacterium]|nr:GTPase Era [Acidobacteriota bacterium]